MIGTNRTLGLGEGVSRAVLQDWLVPVHAGPPPYFGPEMSEAGGGVVFRLGMSELGR